MRFFNVAMVIIIDFASLPSRDAFLAEKLPPQLSTHGELANISGGEQSFLVFCDILGVAKDISIAFIAAWLYDHVVKHNAKSISVNGDQAANREDLERMIQSSIEIGKND